MCILAFIVRRSSRFPFVLVSNRDEVTSRATQALTLDDESGILWAKDDVAGGSWLGINTRTGRFATLTNCRCSPFARRSGVRVNSTDVDVADAQDVFMMPREEALKRISFETPIALDEKAWMEMCRKRPVILPHSPISPAGGAKPGEGKVDGYVAVPVTFVPDHSRGLVVRDFLLDGTVHDPNGGAPYVDGYNLITCNSLFDVANPDASTSAVHYTSNRFAVPYHKEVADGVVHGLCNSYLDKKNEPKTSLLARRLNTIAHESLGDDMQRVTTDGWEDAYDHEAMASTLGACLCDQPQFDILRAMTDLEKKDSAAVPHVCNRHVGYDENHPAEAVDSDELLSLKRIMHDGEPLRGTEYDELLKQLHRIEKEQGKADGGSQNIAGFVANSPWSWERENLLQQNVLTNLPGYATRTQTVVVVERLFPQRESDGCSDNSDVVVHFSQRAVHSPTEMGPWTSWLIDKHGAKQVASRV